MRLVRAAIALATVSGARQHRARRLLVDLGQPDRVEPPAFRVGDLLERLRERIGIGLLIHLAVEFDGTSRTP